MLLNTFILSTIWYFKMFFVIIIYMISDRLKIRKNIIDILLFITGIFINSLAFNVIFVKYNFVSVGLTGISVILNKLVGIETYYVILFGNLILISISILIIGMKKTSKYIIGGLSFTAAVYLTEQLAYYINLEFDDIVIPILLSGFAQGIGEGLVYKSGYSSGGTSILALIIHEFTKFPIASIVKFISYIIVLIGGIVFKPVNIIYSLLIIQISSYFINKITLGVSASKKIYIKTEKISEIKNYVMNDIENGITIIDAVGGYTNKKYKILIVVVPSERCSAVISKIRKIDENAFITVSDCYQVIGGKEKRIFC